MAQFPRYIWVKNKRLYRYEIYSNWDEAYRTAKRFQKSLHNNYYILKGETFWTGQIACALYMTNVIGFR